MRQHEQSANENCNPNVCISLNGSGLYTFVLVIPEAGKTDIKSGFKYPILTKIENKCTHKKMKATKSPISAVLIAYIAAMKTWAPAGKTAASRQL